MDQEWALLRRDAQHADAAGTLVPLSGSRLLRLMASVERVGSERDAALERERVLREALVWITTETFVCVGSGGHLRWSEWLRVQDRAVAALAATAPKAAE